MPKLIFTPRKGKSKIKQTQVESWQLTPFINEAQNYINDRAEYPVEMDNSTCNSLFLITDGQLKSIVLKLRTKIQKEGFPIYSTPIPDLDTISKLSQESCSCPLGIDWLQKKSARESCENFFLKWAQQAGNVKIERKVFEKMIPVKKTGVKVEFKKRIKSKYE